jgi:hypothetical protein
MKLKPWQQPLPPPEGLCKYLAERRCQTIHIHYSEAAHRTNPFSTGDRPPWWRRVFAWLFRDTGGLENLIR